MKLTKKISFFISWIFFSSGIFAILGALYTWGDGPLHLEEHLLTALVPWADLLVTGPFSILAAYGIYARKDWGYITGLMVCGIYLFGSALVYITLAWQGPPYPIQLVLPPLLGIGIGIGFPYWIIRQGFFYQGLPVNPQTDQTELNIRPIQNPIRIQFENPDLN
jgi:hypothetical protein